MIDKKILDEHNLTLKEYGLIVDLIGKEPNITELGIFSLMWSEHCSYKSSKIHLKKLPVTGKNVVQGPGENAGIIDIGEGQAAVFKIESHNHPSFILCIMCARETKGQLGDPFCLIFHGGFLKE